MKYPFLLVAAIGWIVSFGWLVMHLLRAPVAFEADDGLHVDQSPPPPSPRADEAMLVGAGVGTDDAAENFWPQSRRPGR